jgi:uncharacterized protein YbjT (DUF2867 family)
MGSLEQATILLIGGTGTIGAHVARILAGRCRLRGLARSEVSAQRLAELGVEPVHGNLAEARALESAMAGVQRVYLASPRHDQFDHEWNAIEAAERAGVQRIVKVSILYATDPHVVYLRRPHHVVNERLARSPVASTVLEPAPFMTHLAAQADLIAQGRISFPGATARIAHVDPRDVAEVAAAVLVGDAVLEASHPVTGPEALTFTQVAARIGARLGREVRAEDCPPERFRQRILQRGLPGWLADGLVEIYQDFERRGEMAVADTVERMLGCPARSIDVFADDVLAPLIAQGAKCAPS